MAPLCSVLIPSRARPARLLKAIASVMLQATDREGGRDVKVSPEVEVLVRLDHDDPSLCSGHDFVGELEHAGVGVLIGARKQGYLSLASFYGELSAIARAPWIWIMNDDAHVDRISRVVSARDTMHADRRSGWASAPTWLEQLAELPTTGVIVQAEMYKLGGSGYFDCHGSAFPIVPRDAWRLVGYDQPHDPIDTWLDQVLRVQHGWRTRFLRGVAVVHDRDDDAALAEHRRMEPA